MCTGLELAAIGAMVGGGGMQVAGAIDASNSSRKIANDFARKQTEFIRRQREDNDRARAKIEEQRATQAKLREDSQRLTEEAIKRNTRDSQDARQQELTDKRAAGFQAIKELNPVSIDLGGSKNAPSIVQDSINKAVATSAAKGEQQAGALSKILGLNDASFFTNLDRVGDIDNLRNLTTLNSIANTMAGNEERTLNNLASITSGQISNAATGANQQLGVKQARAGNTKAIGDLLFAVGSLGMPMPGSGGATTAANRGIGGIPLPVPKPI